MTCLYRSLPVYRREQIIVTNLRLWVLFLIWHVIKFFLRVVLWNVLLRVLFWNGWNCRSFSFPSLILNAMHDRIRTLSSEITFTSDLQKIVKVMIAAMEMHYWYLQRIYILLRRETCICWLLSFPSLALMFPEIWALFGMWGFHRIPMGIIQFPAKLPRNSYGIPAFQTG